MSVENLFINFFFDKFKKKVNRGVNLILVYCIFWVVSEFFKDVEDIEFFGWYWVLINC